MIDIVNPNYFLAEVTILLVKIKPVDACLLIENVTKRSENN